MPRRELLTSTERLELLAFPTDEGELIRLYTLTKADISFIRQHRGDHNRLGIAVLMSYLRYPGRVLAGNETPYAPVLNIVADQLGIPIDVWQVYAERDATRRSHLLELLPRLGMEQFGMRHYRSISAWLDPMALQTTRGVVLAQAVVEELRKRLIVLPPVAVIERLCAEAMTRAQRRVFALLTEGMNDEQLAKLDRLLEQREGRPKLSGMP
jgi:hypothetical protein